ncbi:MAG: IMP dehydrogenase [Puniceicoccales bacterium]|jgi:IMP dehydrogenase|nr:IMP dehydrogenase [Puniceicoccales bacterium]
MFSSSDATASANPPSSGEDSLFYKPASVFFPENAAVALTYDDVSLATRYSEVLPRQTRLDTVLSEHLTLSLPILSADMDTVTEAQMAIAMALNGGLGLIHYNMSEAEQIRQVHKVKSHIHGMIDEPVTVAPDTSIAEILDVIEEKDYKFTTFPVVDEKYRLLGLLRGSAVRERHKHLTAAAAMTPRRAVSTILDSALGKDPIATADRIFSEHVGINKLLVVDSGDVLRGLFTLSDIESITADSKAALRPTRDEQFRLRAGAAVAIPHLPDGEIDRERLLAHIGALAAEGLDAVAVSSAHGLSKGVGEAVRLIREKFPRLTLIAGNVTSGEGVEFLADAGADAVKIGQGPGSICTTRLVAGIGIPQLTALYTASRTALKKGVRLIADGGVSKSGDIVKALTLADAVILGGMLAGCKEAPGKILEINGKLYKEYRGMGSLEAMRKGSASRYGHALTKDGKLGKTTAEGIEALKEVSGPVSRVLATLAGGVQSGLGYQGAADLTELRARARFIRVSAAGQREASPHDVVQIKTAV